MVHGCHCVNRSGGCAWKISEVHVVSASGSSPPQNDEHDSMSADTVDASIGLEAERFLQ